MTTRRMQPMDDDSTAQQFLRSRARQHGKSDPSKTAPPRAGDTAEELVDGRPQGKEFIHHAMAALADASQFAALVISVDSTAPGAESDACADARTCRLAVSRTLEELTANRPALWGKLEDLQLGCFLSDANADTGQRFARQIKQSLADGCSQTVTIGVADFPCLDYRKDQVLDNACKALEHARFFGPDSLVVFAVVEAGKIGGTYQRGDF